MMLFISVTASPCLYQQRCWLHSSPCMQVRTSLRQRKLCWPALCHQSNASLWGSQKVFLASSVSTNYMYSSLNEFRL